MCHYVLLYFVLVLCFLDPNSLLREKPKKLVSLFSPPLQYVVLKVIILH